MFDLENLGSDVYGQLCVLLLLLRGCFFFVITSRLCHLENTVATSVHLLCRFERLWHLGHDLRSDWLA